MVSSFCKLKNDILECLIIWFRSFLAGDTGRSEVLSLCAVSLASDSSTELYSDFLSDGFVCLG